MNLLTADIKNIATYGNRVFIFSASGVDVYDKRDWSRVMTASITATCGGVNNTGIFLGTTSGVYFLGHGLTGVKDTALTLIFNATDTWLTIQSNTVTSIAGNGNDLLICTDAGADYLPDMVTSAVRYSYTDENGCDHAALDGTRIAYSVSTGLHVLDKPTASWDSTDATELNSTSSPAILADTVQHMAFGADLFIATASGVSVYDGTTVTDFTTALGTVVDCQYVAPASDATDASGVFAFATSDSADGGQFGIYNITGAALETTTSGDTTAAWCDDDWQAAIYTDDTTATLDQFAKVTGLSPAASATSVRRDWSLYAEITDSLGGVTGVELVVDGTTVTPTTTAITNGYSVAYTPAAESGYGQQHSITLSATDSDGNAISRTWSFMTKQAESSTVTSTAIPQVVVIKDIGFESDEADETVDGVEVVWLDEIQHPLIVTEDQAETVGTLAVEDAIYHKHRRALLVDRLDDVDYAVAKLRPGDLIAYTATALGESVKKAEVLAIRQFVDEDDDVLYKLLVQHYELVSL